MFWPFVASALFCLVVVLIFLKLERRHAEKLDIDKSKYNAYDQNSLENTERERELDSARDWIETLHSSDSSLSKSDVSLPPDR